MHCLHGAGDLVTGGIAADERLRALPEQAGVGDFVDQAANQDVALADAGQVDNAGAKAHKRFG